MQEMFDFPGKANGTPPPHPSGIPYFPVFNDKDYEVDIFTTPPTRSNNCRVVTIVTFKLQPYRR